MWNAVLCLASRLGTFPSHLVQQEESACSPATSKSLCQKFISGNKEMSKSELNWSCFLVVKKPKPFFLWEKMIFWKIRDTDLLELLIPVLHLHTPPRCSAMHESDISQGHKQESSHHLCYTTLQKLVGFFVSLLIPNQHFVMEVKL